MGPSTLYPEGPTPTCVQKIMAGYGLGCRTEGPAVFALNPSLVLQGCEVRQGQPQGWWLLWPLLDYDRLPGLARARAGSNLRGPTLLSFQSLLWPGPEQGANQRLAERSMCVEPHGRQQCGWLPEKLVAWVLTGEPEPLTPGKPGRGCGNAVCPCG